MVNWTVGFQLSGVAGLARVFRLLGEMVAERFGPGPVNLLVQSAGTTVLPYPVHLGEAKCQCQSGA